MWAAAALGRLGGSRLGGRLGSSSSRRLARGLSCRVPAAWADVEKDVFPTAADVELFVAAGRYRWEGEGEKADGAANKRLMLRSAAVDLSEEDGPCAAEIERYTQVGTWREAELFESLRPDARHLEALSTLMGVEPAEVGAVMSQIRHTEQNPLGAAMAFASEDDGGPSLDSIVERMKALPYEKFALTFPGKSADYIKNVWDIVHGNELDAATVSSIQVVTRVLALMDALSIAFPHDFAVPGTTREWDTADIVAFLDHAAEEAGDENEAVLALKSKIEAAGNDKWSVKTLNALLSGKTGEAEGLADDGDDGDGDADDGDVDEKEGGVGNESGVALIKGWNEDDGGLAGNGYSSYVLGADDFDTVDSEEYARRLRYYVDNDIRGHMYLALDSIGISVESFRQWVRTGQIPAEWGGSTLDHSEHRLMERHATENALLVQKLGRLVAALRRTPKAIEQATVAPSWRSALANTPKDANAAYSAGLVNALGWAADSLQAFAGQDVPGSPSTPGLVAALDRVSEALRQGEQYTIADNEPHWPYGPEDDGTSDNAVADLNDVLRVVSQVSDALGPGAAPVAALCSDIMKGCERFESTTESMEERTAQAKHEQTESGFALRELQRAAGLSLKEFAEYRRAEYFKKLAAGELSTFEESHQWFMQAREVYWTAAGQQWTMATLQPHLWRAMIDELTAAAREDYYMGFVRAKELDMQQGGRGKGRKGRGRQQKENVFQTNQEALEKLRNMPEWEKLVAHADDATVDWRTPQPGQMQTFQRGTRGNMFAAEENLTPLAEADVDADNAAHPFVTWRTKEFMWSLHSQDPDKWDARSISEQFSVKLPQVECILELFAVAPAFERLYNSGPTDWRAREMLQHNLDVEAEVVAGHEQVINITSLSELQQAANSKTTVRRRRVQLTDVSQADLDEMAIYYDEDDSRRGARQAGSDGSSAGTAAGYVPDDLSSATAGAQAVSTDGADAGDVVHKSKLAIVSTIRPKGRRRKGRRKRNWDDVYIRDFDGTVRKPNATERRLVRHATPFRVEDALSPHAA